MGARRRATGAGICASTGAAALTLMEQLRPALLVLDLKLPDSTGDVIGQLTRAALDGDVRILVCSATASDRLTRRGAGVPPILSPACGHREADGRRMSAGRRETPPFRHLPRVRAVLGTRTE
jgi:CheY-like chemotaxis protein